MKCFSHDNNFQRLQFDRGGMGNYYWEGLGKGLGIRFGDQILRGNTETELEDQAFFFVVKHGYDIFLLRPWNLFFVVTKIDLFCSVFFLLLLAMNS